MGPVARDDDGSILPTQSTGPPPLYPVSMDLQRLVLSALQHPWLPALACVCYTSVLLELAHPPVHSHPGFPSRFLQIMLHADAAAGSCATGTMRSLLHLMQ